jgi:hypothetical protein
VEPGRQLNALAVSAMNLSALAACLIDQNPSHGLGGRREEMAAAVPMLCLLHIHQAQVGFVHESGGLQCLAGTLLGQSLCCQFPQLVVNERQKLLGSPGIALFDGGEDLRDVRHGPCSGKKGPRASITGHAKIKPLDRRRHHQPRQISSTAARSDHIDRGGATDVYSGRKEIPPTRGPAATNGGCRSTQ